MDIIGPMKVVSIGGKRYAFICVVVFLLFYKWILYVKNYIFYVFITLMFHIKNQGFNIWNIVRIWSDHWREFEKAFFVEYCDRHRIAHAFLAPKKHEKNSVAKRKSRTIQAIAWVMLNVKGIAHRFWVEHRMLYHQPSLLQVGHKLLSFFLCFCSTCYILND